MDVVEVTAVWAYYASSDYNFVQTYCKTEIKKSWKKRQWWMTTIDLNRTRQSRKITESVDRSLVLVPRQCSHPLTRTHEPDKKRSADEARRHTAGVPSTLSRSGLLVLSRREWSAGIIVFNHFCTSRFRLTKSIKKFDLTDNCYLILQESFGISQIHPFLVMLWCRPGGGNVNLFFKNQ